MSARAGWREVTEEAPCPICRKTSWCAWTPDDERIKCERASEPPSGWTLVKPAGNGGIFKRTAARASRFTALLDWPNEAERCKAALSSERLDALAERLGVTPESLRKIGIGWASRESLRAWRAGGDGWKDNYPDGAYTVPEHNGEGQIVGLALRTEDGRKGSPSGKATGSKRGLVVPVSLATRTDPVLIVEGATDVAALESLGLAAVGRPSNTGGAKDLAKMLKGRASIVLGERDQKSEGSWPGRDGAERVAGRLASIWKRPVPFSLPPEGAKDVRDWLRSRALDLTDEAGLVIEGATLRRSKQGVRYVAFPRNRHGYPYLWLRTLAARRGLEHQVFEKLGIARKSVQSTAHFGTPLTSQQARRRAL